MSHLVFHPIYSQLDLPVRHRFPIQKYQGIKDALLREKVSADFFHEPKQLTVEALSSVYDPVYIDQLCSGKLDPKAMRRIGFRPLYVLQILQSIYLTKSKIITILG